ncbi:hydrogenase expression/formation protein HypE [Aminiphilus circumscriptus]|jgi:hydrogenase expression/formation protein HypE|uniref:hydrogenase expression/formation protein HypE n=1 Tax=Aminiphilus circumscriptus TaxID=290732 RepID=UPI000492AEAB|nr:hydrogenase expression/formation protein HypE [Aminiphilus circumscriptus]
MSRLTLGHGSGGRLTQQLVHRIAECFPLTGHDMEDCAITPDGSGATMDGFTVTPRFFPGGNLGKLAACGVANDLAVRGVRPEQLLLSVIAEEGFDEEELLAHLRSAGAVCGALEMRLVGGDTKVVPRGAVDGLFLSACALGREEPRREERLGAARLQPGDTILLTGPAGRHGAAIAAARYELDVPGLASDCAALWPLLAPLLSLPGLRAMRDCTRGGVGTVLCEWAESRHLGISVEERAFPVDPGVVSVADLLGLDSLYLACEGTAVVAIAPGETAEALRLLRSHPLGAEAAEIGVITEEHPNLVSLTTRIGGRRLVDMPVGELLPRIC